MPWSDALGRRAAPPHDTLMKRQMRKASQPPATLVHDESVICARMLADLCIISCDILIITRWFPEVDSVRRTGATEANGSQRQRRRCRCWGKLCLVNRTPERREHLPPPLLGTGGEKRFATCKHNGRHYDRDLSLPAADHAQVNQD